LNLQQSEQEPRASGFAKLPAVLVTIRPSFGPRAKLARPIPSALQYPTEVNPTSNDRAIGLDRRPGGPDVLTAD
jgi:hypothetical protein